MKLPCLLFLLQSPRQETSISNYNLNIALTSSVFFLLGLLSVIYLCNILKNTSAWTFNLQLYFMGRFFGFLNNRVKMRNFLFKLVKGIEFYHVNSHILGSEYSWLPQIIYS